MAKKNFIPQQNKPIYKHEYLGVSNSVVMFHWAFQKRRALGSPLHPIDVKHPRTTLSKRSKEKVLAEYVDSHLPRAQETGKQTYNYPSASTLYKSCVTSQD